MNAKEILTIGGKVLNTSKVVKNKIYVGYYFIPSDSNRKIPIHGKTYSSLVSQLTNKTIFQNGKELEPIVIPCISDGDYLEIYYDLK